MEKRKPRQAWVYCAIDAPEDTHDQLKRQYKQLCDYAVQMEFELAGSSSDLGGKPLWKRRGFRYFTQAVKDGRADTLLIMNRNSLSRSDMQIAQFQAMTEEYCLEVFSPLEGKICFY